MAFKKNRKTNIDQIDAAIDRGEDVSGYFTSTGKHPPRAGKGEHIVKKVNIDFSLEILNELDEVAGLLNVSRQSVIKTYVLQGLNHYHLGQAAKRKQQNAG